MGALDVKMTFRLEIYFIFKNAISINKLLYNYINLEVFRERADFSALRGATRKSLSVADGLTRGVKMVHNNNNNVEIGNSDVKCGPAQGPKFIDREI